MGLKNKTGNFLRKIAKILNEKEIVPITQYVDKDNILSNKVALITGGSGGIGSAVAESFIKSGAKVIIAGTNEEKLKNICYKIGGVL